VLSQRPRNAPYTWVPWKFSGLPDYAHGYYSQNFSWTFVPIHPMNVPTKFEDRSFTRSRDNRGTPKNLAAPGYAHAPFSPNFYVLLFGLALKMYSPNLKSEALPIPEIIGVPKKFGQPLDMPTLPFLQIFMGFYSNWPCKCTRQIWSP